MPDTVQIKFAEDSLSIAKYIRRVMTRAVHFDGMRSRKKPFCRTSIGRPGSVGGPAKPNERPTARQYSTRGQRIIHGIIGTKAGVTSYKLPGSIAPTPTAEIIVPRHSTVSRLSGPSATIRRTFGVMLTDTMSYFALIVPEKLPRIRGIKPGLFPREATPLGRT